MLEKKVITPKLLSIFDWFDCFHCEFSHKSQCLSFASNRYKSVQSISASPPINKRSKRSQVNHNGWHQVFITKRGV